MLAKALGCLHHHLRLVAGVETGFERCFVVSIATPPNGTTQRKEENGNIKARRSAAQQRQGEWELNGMEKKATGGADSPSHVVLASPNSIFVLGM